MNLMFIGNNRESNRLLRYACTSLLVCKEGRMYLAVSSSYIALRTTVLNVSCLGTFVFVYNIEFIDIYPPYDAKIQNINYVLRKD
jgi:hypothetical protein